MYDHQTDSWQPRRSFPDENIHQQSVDERMQIQSGGFRFAFDFIVHPAQRLQHEISNEMGKDQFDKDDHFRKAC
jgi:hypothetical protein